jgi:hypothetical protein
MPPNGAIIEAVATIAPQINNNVQHQYIIMARKTQSRHYQTAHNSDLAREKVSG